MIKTQEDFFNKIFTSHFIARVRKGYSRFACERVLETEQKLQYFDLHTYGRQRCVFLVLLMLNWSPGVHFAGCWLSLLCLISNFSGPQTPSGLPRAPSAGCGFPYHNSSIFVSNSTAWLLSWMSYIIVQRPLDHPRDLWNRMFLLSSSGNNCHAVQRSLSSGASVYESIMWFFLLRPISSTNFRPRDFLS